MKPSVFVGSSKEQLHVAEAIIENLEPESEPSTWKHAFPAGQPYFTRLLELKDRFDFAVIVLTPDDITISRSKEWLTPRDNLIFELGLFLGSLEPTRVFAILAEDTDAKIMSDYFGVAILRYNPNRSDGDLTQAVNPACVQIKKRIRDLGRRQRAPAAAPLIEGSLIGLERIYESYELAEQDILADLKSSSGPVRLFFHIAAQNIGLKGSLFDILRDIARRSEPEVRILHSSMRSPLFATDRLLSIGKDPDHVNRSLRFVNEALRDLEQLAETSLRRRQHEYPFIWRLYGFSNRLYLMPYFAKKDATKKSPVLAFAKTQRSMYGTFVDWFDHAWSSSAPDSISLETVITPATPAGTALFLTWQGMHVFGVPSRDIVEGADFVRFYGLGGKRDNPSESLEACALREGGEETSRAVSALTTSPWTDFFRADGTIERIKLGETAVIPRLIFEKREHTGHGKMKRDDDYYYMVAFDGVLGKKPSPAREIAALLFLSDAHLGLFSRRTDITIDELVAVGAIIEEQPGVSVQRSRILVPHGTALYLVRTQAR